MLQEHETFFTRIYDIYAAEWDFAAAVKFKHYAIIHTSRTFLSSEQKCPPIPIVECLFNSEVPNQYPAEVAGAA